MSAEDSFHTRKVEANGIHYSLVDKGRGTLVLLLHASPHTTTLFCQPKVDNDSASRYGWRMATAPVTLEELIRATRERYPDGSELERLDAAAVLSGRLDVLADRLMDHFVREAREAGCSWSEIGEHLGVSRQAAQQRFVGRPAPGPSSAPRSSLERGTERARRIVLHAQKEARGLGHDYVGTEHLLLGLFGEPEGLGAKALDALGVSSRSVREEVERRVGRGWSTPAGCLAFSPRTKQALELSWKEARKLGHDYIGTEHLLLGLVRVRKGVAARILKDLGADEGRVRRQLGGWLSG